MHGINSVGEGDLLLADRFGDLGVALSVIHDHALGKRLDGGLAGPFNSLALRLF
jgi:hypothetical protein